MEHKVFADLLSTLVNEAIDSVLKGWVNSLGFRDNETAGHTERVVALTVALARKLSVPESELVNYRRGAMLHDIGKLGVPDRVFLKQDSLSEDEVSMVMMHPAIARDILEDVPILRPAMPIPVYHHERWDGSGYPFHLSGEEIPLPARIFAVVDVWDAMTTTRPYREAMTKHDVAKYMKAAAGKLFDAGVVEAFIQMQKESQ